MEELKEVGRYSHFEYWVECRRCGDCWRPEKRCDNSQEAKNYIDEFGRMDYKGNFHGEEMRAVEIERVNITRMIKDNKR